MSVLSVNNLSVSYHDKQIISGLNLQVQHGEIVALFGASGGGKSTILKAIAGLLDQVSGEIHIGDKLVLSNNINIAAEHRHTGLIFQDYALFPHLTVAENVAFGLHQLSRQQQQQKVTEMLTLIKMQEYAQHYPHQLSGGQQQRIAIVRALACEPTILLFDEAFSNIDPQLRFELITDIRNLLKAQKISALFVTHNQDEAFAFCDRIAVINQGRIEQVDTPEQLFSAPKTRYIAEFLGEGLWLQSQIQSNTLLQTPFGEATYSGSQNLAEYVGESAMIYLRPHQFTLTHDPHSQLQVHNERFIGECYESVFQWQQQSIKVKSAESFLHQTVKVEINAKISKVFI
ncbi:iron ABC transporter ATP-binding protein [Catenovulum agarivorans DS-2]|uniref:Iron ABC transporter ATP-binding protein n=1 Tax=Catenovulum agarivorans DS-2 TaxID=1328313 RepID=W7QET8_9ALTE|nr:ABC transporter ATP-binding protein [Catenovulum agarivorans]EWH10436.1 iron ABC transporter ATP-binding protein [Catenovulum agarivorans DS-2]